MQSRPHTGQPVTATSSPTPSCRRSRSGSIRGGKKNGVVVQRSKEGCWSCRIRRKKCHGRSEEGSNVCSDCVRLGIECLGWGEKRPEWLKAKNDVNGRRRDFTESLRSRNLIKGYHSKTNHDASPSVGQRESETVDTPSEPESEEMDELDSTSEIPVYPLQSARPAQTARWVPPGPLEPLPQYPPYVYPTYNQTPEQEHPSQDASYSFEMRMPSSMLAYPNGTFRSPRVEGSGALWSEFSGAVYRPGPSANPSHVNWGHTLASKILRNSPDEEPTEHDEADGLAPIMRPMDYTSVLPLECDQLMLLRRYFKAVLPMQYLMERVDLENIMMSLALKFDPSAMLYIAAVQQKGEDGLKDKFFTDAFSALGTDAPSTEKAMSALHLVSGSLFNGCTFSWTEALDYAREWFQQAILECNPVATDFVRRLSDGDDLTKFVSKTTMWMDIFDAVSRRTVPRFIHWYKFLFDPRLGYDVPQMSTTMGADNDVMLAFAEIAELDAWKAEQKRSLSMPKLIRRGKEIEQMLLSKAGSPLPYNLSPPLHGLGPMPALDFLGPTPQPYGVLPGYPSMYQTYGTASINVDPADHKAGARRLTSDVFRAAARVYLHSVLSGCNPEVPEIQQAVQDTIHCLSQTGTQPYDRSLVLPLFIAGVMTDDPDQQAFIDRRFAIIKDIDVGNCGQARDLMRAVWTKRRALGGAEVSWRDTMKELKMALLLV